MGIGSGNDFRLGVINNGIMVEREREYRIRSEDHDRLDGRRK